MKKRTTFISQPSTVVKTVTRMHLENKDHIVQSGDVCEAYIICLPLSASALQLLVANAKSFLALSCCGQVSLWSSGTIVTSHSILPLWRKSHREGWVVRCGILLTWSSWCLDTLWRFTMLSQSERIRVSLHITVMFDSDAVRFLCLFSTIVCTQQFYTMATGMDEKSELICALGLDFQPYFITAHTFFVFSYSKHQFSK